MKSYECHGREHLKVIQRYHRIGRAQLHSFRFLWYSWLIVNGMLMGFAGLAHNDR